MSPSRVRSAAVALALLVSACGEGNEMPDPSEREHIAAIVNEFWAAVVDGDGEQACALLTDRGRRLVPRLTRQEWPNTGETAADCETAVSTYATQLAADERRDAFPSATTYVADDVTLDDDREDAAQVSCEFRGAIFVKRVDGDWVVDIPGCVD